MVDFYIYFLLLAVGSIHRCSRFHFCPFPPSDNRIIRLRQQREDVAKEYYI
jgi:hypothetical protein